MFVEARLEANINYVDKHGNNVLALYLERNEPCNVDVLKYILSLGFN